MPMGMVVYGILPCCCKGIRIMVSNQFSSVSVRGRSSTSAMSSKKDSGTFKSLVRKSKSLLSGHSKFTSSWASTAAFPENRFHNKDFFSSYCILSFVLIPGRGIAGVLFRALPDKLILYCTFVGLNRPFLVVFYKFRGKST